MHQALGSLIRERSFDRITVAQILDRAQVSRSTFYQHFRDKGELLGSAMRELLLTALSAEQTQSAAGPERIVGFSLPLLTHIHQHRRSAKVRLGERGRVILHGQLRRVLSDWIAQTMGATSHRHRQSAFSLSPELLAQHIASTFVLVLHWWLDHNGTSPPASADKLFRALVMPVLRSRSEDDAFVGG